MAHPRASAGPFTPGLPAPVPSEPVLLDLWSFAQAAREQVGSIAVMTRHPGQVPVQLLLRDPSLRLPLAGLARTRGLALEPLGRYRARLRGRQDGWVLDAQTLTIPPRAVAAASAAAMLACGPDADDASLAEQIAARLLVGDFGSDFAAPAGAAELLATLLADAGLPVLAPPDGPGAVEAMEVVPVLRERADLVAVALAEAALEGREAQEPPAA